MDPDLIRIQRELDPYSDPDSQSGSGSKRAKMTQKNVKLLTNFIFKSAGCSLLRTEGFSCSFDVLCGGLFCKFNLKREKNFCHQNPGSVSESRSTKLPKSHVLFFIVRDFLRYHISFDDPYHGEISTIIYKINIDSNFKKIALDKALICKAVILLTLVGYR